MQRQPAAVHCWFVYPISIARRRYTRRRPVALLLLVQSFTLCHPSLNLPEDGQQRGIAISRCSCWSGIPSRATPPSNGCWFIDVLANTCPPRSLALASPAVVYYAPLHATTIRQLYTVGSFVLLPLPDTRSHANGQQRHCCWCYLFPHASQPLHAQTTNGATAVGTLIHNRTYLCIKRAPTAWRSFVIYSTPTTPCR